MKYFLGKNAELKTTNAYYRRAKYKIEAFDEISEDLKKTVVDTNFSDFVLYGKINYLGLPVVPNPNYLKSLYVKPSDDKPIMLMPFLANQVTDLIGNIDNKISVGQINPNDPAFSTISIVSGYLDPIKQYTAYLDMLLETYNKTFVLKQKNKIVTFDDYLLLFVKYCKKMSPNFPCTLSAWYVTSRASHLCTGLFAELWNISKEKDYEKEIIVMNENLEFLVTTCKQHGLYVCKNMPNIVMTNIESPATSDYLFNQGIITPQTLFDKYYVETSLFDLDILLSRLSQFYSAFITNNPEIDKFTVGKNNHLVNNIIIRSNNINYNINNNKYIKYYINIRNIEQNGYYSEADINDFVDEVIYFKKRFDTKGLMSYINSYFVIQTANREGSTNWYRKYMEDK